MTASLLAQAIMIATVNHNLTLDKGGRPYILHPLHVMTQCEKYGLSTQIVGVLHDVVEDTTLTLEAVRVMFGDAIANSVDCISKRAGETNDEYLVRVMSDRDATLVKIEDLKHNSDLSRLKGVTPKDMARHAKYARSCAALVYHSEKKGWL